MSDHRLRDNAQVGSSIELASEYRTDSACERMANANGRYGRWRYKAPIVRGHRLEQFWRRKFAGRGGLFDAGDVEGRIAKFGKHSLRQRFIVLRVTNDFTVVESHILAHITSE